MPTFNKDLVKTPLAATATAVSKKQETTSFVEEKWFTRESVRKYIEPNVFAIAYRFGEKADKIAQGTGWVVEWPDPESVYLATSTHGGLEKLPPYIILFNARFPDLDSAPILIPNAFVEDSYSDITVFRANRSLGNRVEKLGRGLAFKDRETVINKDKLYGLFTFPGEYAVLGGTPRSVILVGEVVHPGQINRYPEPQYTWQVIGGLINPGSSGGVFVQVSQGEAPVVIGGMPRAAPYYKNPKETSEGVVSNPIISSLNIKAMISAMPPRR